MAKAKEWYNSPEYTAIKSQRFDNADSGLVFLDAGYSPHMGLTGAYFPEAACFSGRQNVFIEGVPCTQGLIIARFRLGGWTKRSRRMTYVDSTIPANQTQSGFKSGLILADRGAGKIITIGL